MIRIEDITLPALPLDATDYQNRLNQALYDELRDTKHRLWAIESTLGIAPRKPGAIAVSGATVDGYLDLTEIDEPAAPGATIKRIFAVDDNGFSALETISDDGTVIRLGQDTYRIARNTSGGVLTKGQLVYFSGSTGQVPNVGLARANAEATMPCVGLAIASVAANARGRFIVIGKVTGLNTLAFSEGDAVYVSSATAGAYTATPPSHPNFAQAVGTVERSHVNQGIILFNIAPTLSGRESGTDRNNFTIGDQAAGAKTVSFDNGFVQAISANPTAARTATLPDLTGTFVLTTAVTSVSPTAPNRTLTVQGSDGNTYYVHCKNTND